MCNEKEYKLIFSLKVTSSIDIYGNFDLYLAIVNFQGQCDYPVLFDNVYLKHKYIFVHLKSFTEWFS